MNETDKKPQSLLVPVLIGLALLVGIGISKDIVEQDTPPKLTISPTPIASQQSSTPTTELIILPSPEVKAESISITISPAPSPTNFPTMAPKTPAPVTPKPVATIYVAPTQKPVTNTGGSYACNCSKTCTEISSCTEAQYLLNTCGCGARDADHDGIACDSAPLHCQN